MIHQNEGIKVKAGKHGIQAIGNPLEDRGEGFPKKMASLWMAAVQQAREQSVVIGARDRGIKEKSA